MSKPRVLLDSGAYTASRKGKVINLDEYADFVLKHREEYDGCISLDVIGDGAKSYDNWKYLRGKGVDVIPVYHASTEPIWLEKYLKHSDHIALGAIANLDTTKRIENLSKIWNQYLIDKKGYPKVKVHGLGLTNIPIMFRYPWYSTDSFTPVISAVWGSVLLPLIRDNKFRYLGLAIYRISDQATHTKGTTGSYLSRTKLERDRYEELFEQEGFKLGMITNQEIHDRRGKKGEQSNRLQPIEGLIDIIPSDPSVKTLANHWEERMRWNLTMWTRLQERTPIYPRPFSYTLPKNEPVIQGKKTIMYMGVSTTTHLEIFGKVTPKLDILISYAYLSDNISKMIKRYTK
jgi:hypothetical protein